VVDTGSFTASTLNIKNNDFLDGEFSFQGDGSSKGVKNGGKIRIGGGGHAALLGGYVSNSGTVTAKLGRIAMGSGEKITLDFVGDGLMSITVPTNQLGVIKDIQGRSLKSLVSNSGTLKANGGTVQLSASTAQMLSRGSVNIGSTGVIVAKSYKDKPGKVVIGNTFNNKIKIAGNINVSGTPSTPSGSVYIRGKRITHSGKIHANGKKGGSVNILSKEKLKLDGSIFAKGKKEGGSVIMLSENMITSTKKSIVDVSSQNKAGTVQSLAKVTNTSSGKLKASSLAGKGGKVDITGKTVKLASISIDASGKKQGGKVRIGGEYQGGNKLTNTDNNNYKGFVTRFGDQPSIPNAKQTIVKADTNIDVSSAKGQGGTAIIWSDSMTDFAGSINAKGRDYKSETDNSTNKEFARFDNQSQSKNTSKWLSKRMQILMNLAESLC